MTDQGCAIHVKESLDSVPCRSATDLRCDFLHPVVSKQKHKKISSSSYFGDIFTKWKQKIDGVIIGKINQLCTNSSCGRQTDTRASTKVEDHDEVNWSAGRVTSVSTVWSVLSLFVASTCTLTFASTSWILHPDHLHSFGVLRYCVRDPQSPTPRPTCLSYGDSPSPSGAWRATCVLYGGGCVLMYVSSLVTLHVMCVNTRQYRRLVSLNGYLQTISVFTMAVGLCLFPLGFSTPLFQNYCGEWAGPYSPGHCSIGWSYMLAIMGVALSIFCPIMSTFVDVRNDEMKLRVDV